MSVPVRPDTEPDRVAEPADAPPAEPGRRQFFRWLGLIALGALVLRVGYVLVFKRDEPAIGDAIYYSNQAIRLAEGRGFIHPFDHIPAADHPPLTALAMTPVAWVFGTSLLAQRLAMAVVGTLTVAGLGVLGRTVSASSRVGLVAAGLAALYPNLWLNDGVVMSESIATLTLVAVFLALYRFQGRYTAGRLAVVGALCGLAVLARAESALLLPLVVLPTVWFTSDRPARQRLGVVVVSGLAALAVILPWTAYNLTRFEEPVLLSTNDGLTILGANCDDTYYGDGVGLWSFACPFTVPIPLPDPLPSSPDCAPPPDDPFACADQSEVSKAFRQAGIDYISDHTSRLPVVAVARVGRIWGVYAPGQMVAYSEGDLEVTGEGREGWASWWGYAMWWAMVPLSVYGAVVLRRRGRLVLPLVMTAAVVTVTAVAFYGLVRFRIPAEVAAVVLSAAALDALARARHRRGATGSVAPP
ncbi:MAG: glycosyltransferase family 39 protein [Acidimicrobiales bacterium]|nr:glycosyltransferase family 39 protein [Acidimicrobiales bacterium]